MSRRSDVQNELVSIIQAVLILFVTAERFMAGWKQREEAKKSTERGGVTDGNLTGNFKNIESPGVLFRNVSKRDTGAFNDTGGYDLLEVRNQQHRP